MWGRIRPRRAGGEKALPQSIDILDISIDCGIS
jgi:hypothetical protein